jgi:hypothetical protein
MRHLVVGYIGTYQRSEEFTASVFQFTTQTCKAYDVQNYNFACCFVWCETLSVTLRGKRRLRVLENRVLRKVFRDEVTGEWRIYITRSLICIPHQILFGCSSKE